MKLTQNQQAFNLAAQLFIRGGSTLECHLRAEEVGALALLKQAKAVTMGVVNQREAECAFCGMYRGLIFRSDEGLMVQCPDCGPFRLDPASQRSWQLDDQWLIRKLRGALDIAPHSAAVPIVDGVWDIGRYKKRPVVLARRIDLVERYGIRIFHGPEPRDKSRVITPRPLARLTQDPVEGAATWWQLEDRFALHGQVLRLLGDDPDVLVDSNGRVIPVAVHGPFSSDFAWVHLADWPYGPIRLTEAQARLFGTLWNHRHQAQSAEVLMRQAGLASEKPMDIFKIKAANRGSPLYEGPLKAYEQLIRRQRRLGLYQLAWNQK